MKLVLALGLVLAGCYSPAYKDCDISCASGSCPDGLHCVQGRCRVDPNPVLACGGGPDGDSGIDTSTTNGDAAVSHWNAPTLLMDGMPNDGAPTLRDDLLEMYFVRNLDLWFVDRPSATVAFTQQAMTDFQLSVSAVAEDGPDLSAAGTKIYYAQDATGNQRNILHSSRAGTQFGNGTVVTPLSPTGSNTSPNVSRDGNMVVWERPNDPLTLWTADLDPLSATWVNPRAIQDTATWPVKPSAPMLSNDKLTLYFAGATSGQSDLYEAHRTSATSAWGQPTLITDLSQMGPDERDPWISADGNVIVFIRIVNGTTTFLQATRK